MLNTLERFAWRSRSASTTTDRSVSVKADLIGRLRSLSGRGDVEAKLAHLTWLTDELDASRRRFDDLSRAEMADPATRGKARPNVHDQALEGRSTPAMLDAAAAAS